MRGLASAFLPLRSWPRNLPIPPHLGRFFSRGIFAVRASIWARFASVAVPIPRGTRRAWLARARHFSRADNRVRRGGALERSKVALLLSAKRVARGSERPPGIAPARVPRAAAVRRTGRNRAAASRASGATRCVRSEASAGFRRRRPRGKPRGRTALVCHTVCAARGLNRTGASNPAGCRVETDARSLPLGGSNVA
jgi:hypothetical protein